MPDIRFRRLDRRDSRSFAVVLLLVYVAVVALPAVIVFFTWGTRDAPLLITLGRLSALVGFVMLALQVALTSRVHLIERAVGLDRLTRFHRKAAVPATALVLVHPVLLAAGQGETWRFDRFPDWQVELGGFALGVLVLGVLLALSFGALGLAYQLWRRLHKGMIVIVVLGFIHALVIGHHLQGIPMRVAFWVLFVTTLGIFAWRNVFVPLWGRRRFRVASVTQETHDTFNVALEATDDEAMAHTPGQFMFLTLRRPGMKSEEHPFTISSSPTTAPSLTVTIKQSGDFTNTIGRTKPDDVALIEAPFGRFSYVHAEATALLFIAAGVGITPIMSMLRALRDTGDTRPAVLIFGNKTERDVLFREELSALPANVKVVHVLSKAEALWTGPTGYVTAEVITEHASAMLKSADVYLCGPPPMMDSVTASLRSLGVPKRRIHTERFAL